MKASKQDGFNHLIPAIFEIKGLRVTDGNYSLRGKAVERRAAKIPSEYIDKAKECDKKFANETIQGNDSNCGPFEQALQHFLGGIPLGIVIGGASEVNGLLDEILDTVARKFSSTPDGLMVSPELAARGPNGSFRILKSQFKRIIGCTAARANADLKLRRKQHPIHTCGSHTSITTTSSNSSTISE